MALGPASYDVLLGDGILQELPGLLERYCPAPRYAIITDSSVAPLYGERVRAAVETLAPTTLLTFPAGEWNKSRESWATLTDQLLKDRYDRDSAIVALGGGVVGDLAGFTAATYLRGIRYVQVPTSLLAMIDSSVGGKTGVDTPFGKNLVGAFHQPAVVVADIQTLRSLPPVHVAAGMAEALKHGVIADGEYFDLLMREHHNVFELDPVALTTVVQRSVSIKADVVAQDVREGGRRAILNFGHTVGHALEAVLGYELLHGEAVALGMLAESRLGERLGITQSSVAERLRDALEAFRLPTEPVTACDIGRLCEAIARDKKAREDTVRFALPRTLGEMARDPHGEWTIPVPESAITESLTPFA